MSNILKSSTRLARFSQRRCISSSPISRRDIVQEIYLSELKAYKPAPVAKDAHVGVVKTYAAPSAPTPPAAPTDLASELAAYDALEPVLAAPTGAVTEIADDSGAGAKEFLAFLEKDIPKAEHHH